MKRATAARTGSGPDASTNQFGAHQIRYGVQYDQVSYEQVDQRSGPTFTLVTGQQTATGASIDILPDPTFRQIYRVVRANLNAARFGYRGDGRFLGGSAADRCRSTVRIR